MLRIHEREQVDDGDRGHALVPEAAYRLPPPALVERLQLAPVVADAAGDFLDVPRAHERRGLLPERVDAVRADGLDAAAQLVDRAQAAIDQQSANDSLVLE